MWQEGIPNPDTNLTTCGIFKGTAQVWLCCMFLTNVPPCKKAINRLCNRLRFMTNNNCFTTTSSLLGLNFYSECV